MAIDPTAEIPLMQWILAFACGGAFWTLLEYFIHGLLSHRWTTFVSPLHGAHHREPRQVFTSPLAVLPSLALIFAVGSALFPWSTSAAFCAGALAGFARYERVHWRIHFREPRNARERHLRSHHLAHHFRNPRAYHGVTTRFWDRVFRTLPSQCESDYARFENAKPLEGRSNLREVWNPRIVVRSVLAAWRDAPGAG
jgi:sterol desaturase/sphingolipid hydroxylase (fatty acid hydroxylase superfamily)